MYLNFKKDGIYYGKEKIESIFPYLKTEVHGIEDMTLEDLFDILNEYEDEVDACFLSFTRGHLLKPFYEEIKSDNKEKNDYTELNFHWNVDNYEYENDELEIEKELFENITITLRKVGDTDNYAVSFINLSEIKSVVITLNLDYIIRDKNYNSILETRKFPSLFELIGNFLYEITFDGYPEQREERSKELMKRYEEIDDSIQEYFSLDDLKLEMMEKQLQRFIDEEKYEKAEVIKKRINDIKEKNNGNREN